MGLSDTRGQSVQIGFIIIFGAGIIALSVYVATVIPQENKQVEFNHFENVKDDMKLVRDAVLSAGGSGTTQSVSVQLGTTYPARILGVNPPPPSGTLQTAAQGQISFNRSISINGLCGYAGTARAFKYTPNYHELEAQPIVYDNSAVYVNGSGEYAILSAQTLIDGRTIQFTPLNASFSASGSGRETLTFKGGPANGTVKTFDNELVMTVPTLLPASEWENNSKLLGDQSRVKSVEPAENQDNAINITLKPATYTVACRAVGINGFPSSGSAQPPGIDTTGYGEGGEETYDPNNPDSETLATKGGKLVGIINASNVVLQDPAFAPTQADTGDLTSNKNRRYLRLGFIIQNGTVGQDNYSKFYFVVGDKVGMNYEVPSDNLQWNKENVYLYRENDSETTTPLIDGEPLATSQLNGWLKDGERMNLLNDVNYVNSNNVKPELNKLASFMNNTDQTSLIITNLHGRVSINITSQFTQQTGGQATVAKVVFRGTSNDDLKAIGTDSVVTTYTNPSQPKGIGPFTADLGIGDSGGDIPFKGNSNGYLRAVDGSAAGGTVQTLDSTQILGAPIDVGDWDGDGNNEIVYIDNNNELTEYEPATASTNTITDNGGSPVTGVAVAGVGNIDGDGVNDLTFVGNSQSRLKYLESGANPKQISNNQLDVTTAVSQPADFDGDGNQEVAVYDDSDKGIDLYESSGSDVSHDPTYDVAGAPMATIDWRRDGDGTPDIVLVDSNNELRYLDWTGKNSAVIEDSNGNDVSASGSPIGAR